MEKKIVFLSIGFLFLFSALLFAQDNKALFEEKCSKCHSINRPLSFHKNKAGWKETVKRMQSKSSAGISDKEAEIIINYLTEIEKHQSH